MTVFGLPVLPLVLIAGGVLTLLLGRLVAGTLRNQGDVIRRKWRSVPVKILSSTIVETEGEDGPLYSPEIRYEYTVDGTRRESDRISLFPKWSSSVRERSQKVIADFPTGRECSGWAHPSNLDKAVLNPETFPPRVLRLGFIILVGSGVFLILGGALAWIFRLGSPA
jgi:hypothetical protein